MRRFACVLLGITMVICFLCATERTAWGYVDPGSGLLALQGFASVLGTAAYYFRRRIRALFDRKPASETAACTADQTRESENAA
jgi:hypothetical protein